MFPMTKVEIIGTYRLYDIGRARLEQLIHRIFAPARLDIEIKDRCGKFRPVKRVDAVGPQRLRRRRLRIARFEAVMADSFTIRIFVPGGDPEGVRMIDRMNWTGLGLVFRRSDWSEVRKRDEMRAPGSTYLWAAKKTSICPPYTLGRRRRKGAHRLPPQGQGFLGLAAVFVSTSGGLNRAHVTWLEYALIKRATETKRCILDNGISPQEPALTEAEKADTHGFMKEILQILPLVGLRAFEFPRPVAAPRASDPLSGGQPSDRKRDTIIVPAQRRV